MTRRVRWLDAPERHDFDAAADFLALLMPRSRAVELAGLLRDEGRTGAFKAKDIIRASRLAVLTRSNRHVAGNLEKIRAGEKLSPVLLVRPANPGDPLIVADGYHRVSAVYQHGEDDPIPCRIVNMPPLAGAG